MKLGKLIFLDTETTGVDPKTDRLLEVAHAVWDVPARTLVSARTDLIWHETSITENPAEKINRIPAVLYERNPMLAIDDCMASILMSCNCPTAIVAHSADFDRQWLPGLQLPWICSMDDLPYPRFSSSKGLAPICLAHGVGVVAAHRAIDDVLTLVRLFERVAEMLGSNFEEWLALGLRPKALFVVADRDFDAERNKLAKEHGFRWDADARHWARRMAIADADRLPFRVEKVGDL